MPLGLSLGGADAANYTLSSSTASTTAFIAQATLTPVITADGRTYNGSTLVTLASQTASTPFIPDVVNLEVGASSFTSKSAGTETVTATGLSLGGADAANYTLSATTASTTAVIAQATLTPVITADGRTYNGSTLVTLASQTASTPFIPDVVNLEVGASSFTSKSAGTETVTATGLSLGGADAANYTLSATTASTTAVIAQATLTPVITADGRTYNGSTLVTLASQTASTPFIPDVVNLEVGASSFTSKSAGTETVTATGLSLSGADAANYTLSATTASTTAVIAQATLTPVITADGRTYNGSTLVTLASQTASTPFIPDVVNLEVGASSFTSKSAGTETVTATGLSLGGADAANYTLSATTASTTAVIAQATLTPVITADGRTYNGSTLVTLASQTASTPFIPDVVNLEVGASSFTSKSAGTETVTATGLSLGGADAANYTLSATTASTTAVIAQATLTPVITADGRTYNGSTLVTLASQTASTPFIPDVVNLEVGASSFTSKSAGTETVTATGLSLGGADAANYTLSATTASTTAVIAQATLTPVITADGRTYNGSTLVTLASQTASTPFIPDVVNLEVGASSFTSKSAGTETVTATGLSLSGADAANYTLSATTASTTAVIAQATLTPVITADGRTYNGSTLVTLASQTASTPFIPDVVNLEVGASSFTSKSAGTETVTATGLSLNGTRLSCKVFEISRLRFVNLFRVGVASGHRLLESNDLGQLIRELRQTPTRSRKTSYGLISCH